MKTKINKAKILQAIKKIEYGKNNPEKWQFYFNSDLMIAGLNAKIRWNDGKIAWGSGKKLVTLNIL